MFRSATFKLTMWYLAIVMAISIVFSFALYRVTTGELNRGLHRESQRIFTQFPVFQNDPQLRPGRDYQTSAHHLLLQLIGLNALVFVGAGFSSYWLARRTLEPIEQAHQQQVRFTADVSHELRTPLTALKMESEVALLNPSTNAKELRSTLQSNLEEVAKLELLINNLLRLTRLEADTVQQQFTAVNAKEVVEAAVEQVQIAAQRHDITLAVKASDATVMGDRDSLVQLLVILIDNAIKYSQSGQTVRVGVDTTQQQASFSIADEGIGIEPEAMEHIFDRFYRADSSRTKIASEGYGLGLSIAKLIADVHGTTITLHSRVGKGTTARMTMPLATTGNTPVTSHRHKKFSRKPKSDQTA